MYEDYQTRAFFLKKENRGEADQLFTLFTEKFGRIAVRAKGIRKISAKLRGSANLFYLADVAFVQGRSYKILTDALLIERFKNLSNNKAKLAAAHNLALLFDQLVSGQISDRKVWQLLQGAFFALEKAPPSWDKLKIIEHHFFWNLTALLGWQPQLYHCPLCRKKLKPETFFLSPLNGGVVCWACFNRLDKTPFSHIVYVNSVKIIRFLLTSPVDLSLKIALSPLDLENLEKSLANYCLGLQGQA